MLARTQNNRNSHSMLKGMQSTADTSEYSFAVSSKLNIVFTIRFNNYIPRHLPNWFENLCLRRNLHVHVCSSFIHNHPNLEATKVFCRWVDKQTIVLPYNGMPFSVKKRNCYKATEKPRWILNACNLVLEARLKGIHSDSTYMTFLKSTIIKMIKRVVVSRDLANGE